MADSESIRKPELNAFTLPQDNEKANHVASVIQKELQMTFLQAIRKYPKAAAWSIFMSTAVIMEGILSTLIS